MRLMFLSAILFVVLIQVALACKIDSYLEDKATAETSMLEKKPLNARHIYAVEVVENQVHEQYFKIYKNWTKTKEVRLKIPSSLCPRRSFIIGERFLLLANDVSYLDYILIYDLQDTDLTMIDQLSLKKDFVENINPSWQYCLNSSECKVVKSKCGGDISINKKYEKAYLSFLSTKVSNQNICSSPTGKSSAKVKNKCINYFCE